MQFQKNALAMQSPQRVPAITLWAMICSNAVQSHDETGGL